MNNHLHL